MLHRFPAPPRVWAALAVAVSMPVFGCSVPSVPDLGAAPGPTLRGTVQGASGANLRVGLLGALRAGGQKRELASSSAASGSYTLQVPSTPPLDLMLNDNESVVFTLQAYKDLNGNQKYDATDELSDAAATGSLRYFDGDGPAGTYKKGWNLFRNGTYAQSFDVAMNLQ